MKLAAQLALGALVAIAISSCWVDRKTSEFSCSSDNDCTGYSPTRVCDTDIGYCVPGENPNDCPSICNGACNKGQKTCTINCGTGTNCNGTVVCPEGYDCTINCSSGGCDAVECNGNSDCTITCSGGNACGNIDCSDSGTCDVTCSAGSACGDVDCNGSDCSVSCSGGNACDRVDCDNACRCDVTCIEGTSCDFLTCSATPCESATGCTSTQNGCPVTCGN